MGARLAGHKSPYLKSLLLSQIRTPQGHVVKNKSGEILRAAQARAVVKGLGAPKRRGDQGSLTLAAVAPQTFLDKDLLPLSLIRSGGVL